MWISLPLRLIQHGRLVAFSPALRNPFNHSFRLRPLLSPKCPCQDKLNSQRYFRRHKDDSAFSKYESRSGVSPPAGVLLKATGFTVLCCGCFYVAAAVWQYERVRAYAAERRNQLSKFLRDRGVQKSGEWRRNVNQWWNNLSDGDKVFWPICLLNLAVFLAWRVPAWEPVMQRWFMCNPYGKSPYLPMLLSSFSHFSIAHLFINMYVLNSFMYSCVGILGPEQFLALYLSGAMTASLASHAVKILRATPGVSLGASGSLMCIVGFACTQMPNLQLSIIFLPMFQFSAAQALKAIVAFDAAGVILNWTFLDHAAHLGGVALGILYANYGSYIWERREAILEIWHKMRSK